MFQFRRFPSYSYVFTVWYLAVGFPIRKSPDRSLFAAPRSLSQLITSFIGSWCQGIPLALFLAWPSSKSLPRFSVNQPQLLAPSDFLPRVSVSPLKSKPAFAGLLICFLKYCAKLRFVISNLVNHIDSPNLVLYYSWIMQAHLVEVFCLAKIVFYPFSYLKNFPLCCLLIIAS